MKYNIPDCPKTFKPRSVTKKATGKTYTFDAVVESKDSILIVKIHDDLNSTFDKDAFLKIDEYLPAFKDYRNKTVMIFSVQRFSEYVTKEAKKWSDLKLIISDRFSE